MNVEAEIGRLFFSIRSHFFSQSAGRSIHAAMVISHQTFGEFAVWHPHGHSVVLEDSFDRHDRFFSIPPGANEALMEIWHRRVFALFLTRVY